MGPYVEGFEASLLSAGYTSSSVRNILKDVGVLGRWMAEHDVEVEGLRPAVVGKFRRDLRARRRRRVPGPRALNPLLSYLRSQGVLGESVPPTGPVEALLTDYRRWLVGERGLADATVLRYESCARRFLMARGELVGGDGVRGLSGADVVAFLTHECTRVSVGAAKGRVAELRSLLRFLYVTGRTALPLATAVPPVAGWHDTRVPVGISAEDVQRLLDGCDRTDRVGVRDFALLMLVARLGLRSIEVARLELTDIDWRAGRILVRGKGSRKDYLPLPWDVGEALAMYLAKARPANQSRQVFLCCKAPVRGIRPDLVSDVTRRACDRAGVARVGAHRLRHALASELLRRGAALVEVSQVLRHRDLATTAIYAKVDITRLRTIAAPWPGATR